MSYAGLPGAFVASLFAKPTLSFTVASIKQGIAWACKTRAGQQRFEPVCVVNRSVAVVIFAIAQLRSTQSAGGVVARAEGEVSIFVFGINLEIEPALLLVAIVKAAVGCSLHPTANLFVLFHIQHSIGSKEVQSEMQVLDARVIRHIKEKTFRLAAVDRGKGTVGLHAQRFDVGLVAVVVGLTGPHGDHAASFKSTSKQIVVGVGQESNLQVTEGIIGVVGEQLTGVASTSFQHKGPFGFFFAAYRCKAQQAQQAKCEKTPKGVPGLSCRLPHDPILAKVMGDVHFSIQADGDSNSTVCVEARQDVLPVGGALHPTPHCG